MQQDMDRFEKSGSPGKTVKKIRKTVTVSSATSALGGSKASLPHGMNNKQLRQSIMQSLNTSTNGKATDSGAKGDGPPTRVTTKTMR